MIFLKKNVYALISPERVDLAQNPQGDYWTGSYSAEKYQT